MAAPHRTDRRATASRSEDDAHLLMRSGVLARCADCGDEGLFVPVDDHEPQDGEPGGQPGGQYCCTRCDAAVFLLEVLSDMPAGRERVGAASA